MTAVEWLIDQIINNNGVNQKTFEQAKEMEKQQIIDAWIATDNELQRIAAVEYYNEIYGSKGSDDHIVDTNEMVSSQTENKGLDWLVNRWKKLQAKGEKMSWNQIIQITELAKELPSSQTEISDEEIEKEASRIHGVGSMFWEEGAKWYREQLKSKICQK